VNEDGTAVGQLERWVRSGATIIAPATALSAVLFYFGYVSARAQYEYFGIDVDTIGLGTQDYIMRSPTPLLVPLLVLALVGIGVLALLGTTRRWANKASNGARVRRLARGCQLTGLSVLGVGVTLLLVYVQFREWAYYPLVTPLLVGFGATLIAYGNRVRRLLRGTPVETHSLLLRRSSEALVFVVIAVSVFWTTATVAQWSGRGLAQHEALNLDRLPSVILDTKERLFLRSPGVEETVLDTSEAQTFHYRYRNLRLLIHGNNRMFLVPDNWSASNSTMVVQLDGSTRVQFQFQNERP
jgi:hypothetical protein